MKLTDVTDFIGMTNTRSRKEKVPEEADFNREHLGPKKTYMHWEAEHENISISLPVKYRRTFAIIGGVIIFFLLIMKEFWLILVMASIFFIANAMSKMPTEKFKYELSTHGLKINDDFYYWDEITRFFIANNYGTETVAIDVVDNMPPRLFIAFKPEDKKKIIEHMNKHVPYLEKEPLTFVDKAYTSLVDKLDLQIKKR